MADKKKISVKSKKANKKTTVISVVAIIVILAAAVFAIVWSMRRSPENPDDKPVIDVSDTVTDKVPENTNVVTAPLESDTSDTGETTTDESSSAPDDTTADEPDAVEVTIDHNRSSASGELPDGYSVTLDVDAPKMRSEGYGENVSKFNSIVSTEVEELKNRYAQTLGNPGENGGSDMSYKMSFDVTRNEGGLVSVVLKTDNYLGGTEDEYAYKAINFDLNSGKQLTLGDMFAVEKDTYVPFIKSLILKRMRNEPTKYYSTDDKALDEAFDETHFYITSNGITVYFNEYDIAPSAEGVPTFDLSYADLAQLMAY
ncbi:MAG: DUF3298 domain-containing protein [Clostridia bacterium]|nr:DUF3298 domain-containing protein [Clostridia bacterium]